MLESQRCSPCQLPASKQQVLDKQLRLWETELEFPVPAAVCLWEV